MDAKRTTNSQGWIKPHIPYGGIGQEAVPVRGYCTHIITLQNENSHRKNVRSSRRLGYLHLRGNKNKLNQHVASAGATKERNVLVHINIWGISIAQYVLYWDCFFCAVCV